MGENVKLVVIRISNATYAIDAIIIAIEDSMSFYVKKITMP